MRSNLCKECGDCCSNQYIRITEKEYQRLKKYILPLEKIDGFYILHDKIGSCIALTPEGCKIPFQDRPGACQMFPYVVVWGDKEKGESRIYLSTQCTRWKEFPLHPSEQVVREIKRWIRWVKS